MLKVLSSGKKNQNKENKQSLAKLKLEEGLEGRYVHDASELFPNQNGQFEFILNNTLEIEIFPFFFYIIE